MMFLSVLHELVKSPEPEDLGEIQADAVGSVGSGPAWALLQADGGGIIGSSLDRMRAAGEHAAAEAVRRVAAGRVIDCDE
jgi:hypothetical protein